MVYTVSVWIRIYLSLDNGSKDSLDVLQVLPPEAGSYAAVEEHQFGIPPAPPPILHQDVARVKVTVDKIMDEHLKI